MAFVGAAVRSDASVAYLASRWRGYDQLRPMNDERAWVERYLDLLRLEREPPSLSALERLCRAQIETVPFENTTAILRRAGAGDGPVPPIDHEVMLAAWVAGRGGGVCFDAAPLFRRLLLALGYRARASMALISFPGSHQASVVELEGRDWLVDVANGAPFYAPIPLDRETILRHAGLAWRFRPEEPAVFVQDRFVDGQWQPFCRYDLRPVDPTAQEAAFQRHQRAGETWVVGGLTLVRCTGDTILRLRDSELITFRETGKTVESLDDAALDRVAADRFGLPGLPIVRARAALRRLLVPA